jgi:hypothetical protein
MFFALWILIPPYPHPEELHDATYSELVSKLGPPSHAIAGKYVAWESGRLVGAWVVEASFDEVPTEGSTPGDITRFMWIGKLGYSINVFMTVDSHRGER